MASSTSTDVYAAILARIDQRAVQEQSSALVHDELEHILDALAHTATAMQRLREVQHAAASLDAAVVAELQCAPGVVRMVDSAAALQARLQAAIAQLPVIEEKQQKPKAATATTVSSNTRAKRDAAPKQSSESAPVRFAFDGERLVPVASGDQELLQRSSAPSPLTDTRAKRGTAAAAETESVAAPSRARTRSQSARESTDDAVAPAASSRGVLPPPPKRARESPSPAATKASAVSVAAKAVPGKALNKIQSYVDRTLQRRHSVSVRLQKGKSVVHEAATVMNQIVFALQEAARLLQGIGDDELSQRTSRLFTQLDACLDVTVKGIASAKYERDWTTMRTKLKSAVALVHAVLPSTQRFFSDGLDRLDRVLDTESEETQELHPFPTHAKKKTMKKPHSVSTASK